MDRPGTADRPQPPAPPPFRLVADGGRLIAAGELDLATAARLHDAIAELASRHRHVAVDLRRVTFIDSSGISALVQGADRAGEHGARVEIVEASRPVARLLDVCGLTWRFGRQLRPVPRRAEHPASAG